MGSIAEGDIKVERGGEWFVLDTVHYNTAAEQSLGNRPSVAAGVLQTALLLIKNCQSCCAIFEMLPCLHCLSYENKTFDKCFPNKYILKKT